MIGTSDGRQFDSIFELIADSGKATPGYDEEKSQYKPITNKFNEAFDQFSPGQQTNFETKLTPAEEEKYQDWKKQNAPKDSGFDYDFRGAYLRGITVDPDTQHWPDTFKKPNHPTFSDQSMYAKDRPDLAGTWDGDKYIPPTPQGKINSDFEELGKAFKGSTIDVHGQQSTEIRPIIEGKTQSFMPDIYANPGSDWPKVLPRTVTTFSGDSFKVQSVFDEMLYETAQAQSAHKAISGFLDKHKINPKAWDEWLKNAPESENIQDRRGGYTNGQYLFEKFQDWLTELTEGRPPGAVRMSGELPATTLPGYLK